MYMYIVSILPPLSNMADINKFKTSSTGCLSVINPTNYKAALLVMDMCMDLVGLFRNHNWSFPSNYSLKQVHEYN